ncbi:UDP-3-O-(3-hydroxymyristoyl)glucosamine N-acyltransferase [Marinimicrobium sp. ABcell2]|uniref:UDP-3-O-(3-hydroxymyristoyl)glucosamine N-acyltransferase n=1 Tax=Marinimicrobium sp. ABcell2 TaxID=3069751 RepID=UPI0027ADF52C|nr:UDP-3-O-(3-hydroxymyristoyl)glucosamine N-acyltransferase [Marinimicrobium sp. ABcell2]MDQ2077204.1 UDP-3-O-(3-hydroxymyristoyl)glucosamine N-acyltransferase [Marinimicrobium sp. ABcell2]
MTTPDGISLSELAKFVDAEVTGEGQGLIRKVAPLNKATTDSISFFSDPRYRNDLANTKAGAVILKAEHAENCPVPALVVDNPYYAYAKIADRLHPRHWAEPGIHPTAVVSEQAVLGQNVSIGAHAVVEAGARIGENSEIGAGGFIGAGAQVGPQCWFGNGVTIERECIVGARAVLHPGVVIGADGFGFAPGPEGWRKVPQIGRVLVGDDVEIGANTTIDRGTQEDTVIENGVKLDNLVHIGHNTRICEGTIIAGCTVVAGSTTIGKNCTIGGAAVITGHIEIADNTTLMGMSAVTGNIREAGVYSSPLPVQPVQQWRRNAARFPKLDDMFRRMKMLEREIQDLKDGQNQGASAEPVHRGDGRAISTDSARPHR